MGRNGSADIEIARDVGRNFDFRQMLQGGVESGVIFLDDSFTAFAEGFINGFLDSSHRFGGRQDTGDGKEAGLHDGVDASAQSCFASHFAGVQDEKAQFFADDLLLDSTGEVIPNLIGAVRAVQQESRALLGGLQEIQAVEKGELMASNEAGAINEIA